MANIFLTNECRRSCKFCFAKRGPWSEDYPARAMTLDEIEALCDMEGLDNIPERGLVGGEPLLHPQLMDFLNVLWKRHYSAKIFTSGTVPFPPELASPKGGLRFIANVSPMETYEAKERSCLEKFLTTFGHMTSLSYTISAPDADTSFLTDIIERYNLLPDIRVGVAVPAIGSGNEHIESHDYARVGQHFLDLARTASASGIRLGMDCGFVACMFTTSEIGELISLGTKVDFVCEPVIDIGPGLKAWHCFPLAALPKVSLADAGDLRGMHGRFKAMNDGVRKTLRSGIYERCDMCSYRERGQCAGGCLALAVQGYPESCVTSAARIARPSDA